MEQYPIGCLLKMITDKIKIQADANLAQHDLTLTQSRVLGYLARNGGTATQKEIEGFLQVSHPDRSGRHRAHGAEGLRVLPRRPCG